MLLSEKRTERIDLGDGDWAEIILSLDTRQAAQISDLYAAGQSSQQVLGLLELIVDSWSSDLPVKENVGRLAPEATAKIMKVFNERVRGLDPKVSSSPSTDSSTKRARGRTKT